MTQITVEKLLEMANSAPENDTSINQAQRQFLDDADLEAFYQRARERLFQIPEWRKCSSATDYDLFDENGNKIDEPIDVGRFIRIRLYGSGKYDWVRAISISDSPGGLVLTVKPSHDPTDKPIDENTISHFFGPEATNNFCLQRQEKRISFYVIGLNERQNTKFTDSLIESARNVAVANVGYYSGLQKTVWKEFCSNFLKYDEERSN